MALVRVLAHCPVRATTIRWDGNDRAAVLVELALPRPPAWTRLAACHSRWADLDWIDPTPEQALRCRAVCRSCPVRDRCLTTALSNAEPSGIWGGLDPDERADLARASGFPIPIALPAQRHAQAT